MYFVLGNCNDEFIEKLDLFVFLKYGKDVIYSELYIRVIKRNSLVVVF